MKFEETIIKFCPKSLRLPFKYHYWKIRNRLEKEILYLKHLGGSGKRAIDIGANQGIYSYALSQIFDCVESFEPQYWCTEEIVAYSQAHGGKINVYNVGLSDSKGVLTLHIPTSNKDYSQVVPELGSVVTGVASFRKLEGKQISVEVPVQKLDDYNFTNVSFIKIDVEGYESKVLAGGRETIVAEKPIILIEIEQRHLDGKHINEIFEQILELGYQGSFLSGNAFVPLSKFSYKKNQEPFLNNLDSEQYIRNFIFQPIYNSIKF